MLIAGLLQGAILLALHEWWDRSGFHVTDLLWLAPMYALALVYPFSFNFLRSEFSFRPSLYGASIVAGAISLTALWYGWSTPIGGMEAASVWENQYWQGGALIFGLTSFTIWFVALPFLQNGLRSRELVFSYSQLFNNAWRNTLLVANCIAFTGAFWLLLLLWSELFRVIKIEFFHDLFTSRRFIYPATAMAISFAISLEEREASALTTLRRYLLAFQTRLLPLAGVILLLFVAALPFTGLKPLWNTGMATPLMLWLQLVLIALTNAAWQDEALAPFKRPTQFLIRSALLLLPLLSALCIWSLSLRVGQHGWSVDRVWAGILTALTCVYALGYAASALKSGWLPWLGKVNVMAAWAVIASLLAVHTPLLDPQRIATASQLEMLFTGKIEATKFDYNYLRFKLGRAGDQALNHLTEVNDHPQAATIREKASSALKLTNRYSNSQNPTLSSSDIAAKLDVWPKDRIIDPAFLDYLAQRLNKQSWDYPLNSLRKDEKQQLLIIDLGASRDAEYVLLACPNTVFSKFSKGWQQIGQINFERGQPCDKQLHQNLELNNFSALPQQWHDLRLGQLRGRFTLSNEFHETDSGDD